MNSFKYWYDFTCPLDKYKSYNDDRFNELSSKIRLLSKVDFEMANKFSNILVTLLIKWYPKGFIFRSIIWSVEWDEAVHIKDTSLEMGNDELVQIWDMGKPKYLAFYHKNQFAIEKQVSTEAQQNIAFDLPILFLEFMWKMGLTYQTVRRLYRCEKIKEKKYKL